jgi:TRAP transporter 4TM/12TM fusion protein
MALNRQRSATGLIGIVLILVAVMVSLLAIDSQRILGQPILGSLIGIETHYFYLLLMLLMPVSFLLFRSNSKFDLIYLDIVIAAICCATCAWFYLQAENILDEGWEFEAPPTAIYLSGLLWLLALEATRRVGGWILFFLVLLFSLYPLVADSMPSALSGMSVSLTDTAIYHAMSSESILGLPFRAFANLVIGFLVFGVALKSTGGGQFFIDFSFSLLGKVRGGPAKVAVLSSGLMGSMSGSVITNVLTTGQLTIPAMKKSGFDSATAAGVEACASTGGVLLPPVMGSTAFVMATFLGVPYYEVALAAFIPALLYFVALFIQLDAYAAKNNLSGAQDSEIPTLLATLRDGWYYLGAFLTLIFLLLVLQREALAPWVATAVLILINQFSSRHRWDLRGFLGFLSSVGALFVELLVILSGVGLIVGALSLTGLSGTLVNELLFLAGGSTAVLLLMGGVTSFVLGIGMTVTAAYIFLAIVLAPALIQGGLAPMSVHMFILYWGMLSFITPPVALGAFAAASIAGAKPMTTGFRAMQLGIAAYCIPFFFILQPALLLDGTWIEVCLAFIETLLGIWLIAGAVQGYLQLVGKISWKSSRLVMGVGGFCIAMPGLESIQIDLPNTTLLSTGLVLTLLAAAQVKLIARRSR